jgi:hypothetical protein
MEHGRRDLSRLTVMILSGIAMLSEDALRCFYSPASAGRWALLAAAVLFYFTLRRRALLTLRPPPSGPASPPSSPSPSGWE